ncbi:sulfite exporter TauE/SafE family protein [Flavobacterium sp.]|jgi:sulfite exporter TauE/SafE|uniref:sulfite exporter TauE/SafE family protein n=1 Tax=Flavobacterium sp. TaxID=239 RepID=UPI0037C07BD7
MLYTAFIFGLISSFHCVGMCGPIAMMLPVDRKNEAKRVVQISLYHLGKLTAYGLLGLIFGLLGKSFYLAGLQQQLSIILGILMIVVAVVPEKIFAKYNFSKPVYKIITKIKSSLGQHFKNKSYRSLFTIGLLNGFLPCGMVYVAIFGAIAMQSVTLGILYMILFGIGTIPLLTAIVYLSTIFSFSFRKTIQNMIPIVAILIGMLFIIRGLGLDIPYLSPSDLSLFIKSEANCH